MPNKKTRTWILPALFVLGLSLGSSAHTPPRPKMTVEERAELTRLRKLFVEQPTPTNVVISTKSLTSLISLERADALEVGKR